MSYTGCSRLPQSKAVTVGEFQEDQWALIDRVGEWRLITVTWKKLKVKRDKLTISREREATGSRLFSISGFVWCLVAYDEARKGR